jgi:hypothetical protein
MVQYHFRTNAGPAFGPIDAADFKQRQEAGEITHNTMVWRSGLLEWTTCAGLHAIEQRAAQSSCTTPPPLPAKTTAIPARPAVQFIPCSACAQAWPGDLLTVEEGQKICGNCLNRKKQEKKDGKKKNGPGNGLGTWAMMIIAIICAACLAYKVTYYGIKLPKAKVQMLAP